MVCVGRAGTAAAVCRTTWQPGSVATGTPRPLTEFPKKRKSQLHIDERQLTWQKLRAPMFTSTNSITGALLQSTEAANLHTNTDVSIVPAWALGCWRSPNSGRSTISSSEEQTHSARKTLRTFGYVRVSLTFLPAMTESSKLSPMGWEPQMLQRSA